MEITPDDSTELKLIINGHTFSVSNIFLLAKSKFAFEWMNLNKFSDSITVDIPESLFSKNDYHYIEEYLKNDDIQISLHNKDVLYHFGKKLEINSLLEKIATFDSNLEKLSKSENIQKISECLDLFLNLTTDNFESSVERIFLMEHFEKHFDEYFFGKLFFLLFRIRPYKYSLFLDFLTRLQTQGTLDFPKILNILISKSKGKCLFIIRGLFDSGFLTIDEAKNVVAQYCNKYLHLMMDITENTQTCTPFLKFNTPFYQIPSLVPKNNEISVEQLKENNFELHKKYCTLGISTDRIFQVLMNDDYDELQKYASELGFNVNGKFLHFNTSLVNIFNQIKIFNYITEDRDMYNRLNIIKFPPKYINICAYFGSKRCFDFLKINKAEIAQDTLIYAIAGGSVEIIREIEAELVDLDQQTCQLYAICFHQNDIFEWLCNKYGIIGTEILLKHCIKYYNYKALLFLISEGADVQNLIYNSLKNHNFTLLHLAMNLHYLKNPFKVKEGPLNLAIRRNHIDIIKKMMMLQQAKEAVDFQSNIGTPFSCAIENENYEIISALLEINNSVYNQTFSVMLNAYSLVKFTPLTYSLYLNKYDITTMLLTFPNININDVDSENFTPLHLACMNDQIEIVKTLLSSDEIEINKVNNKDECPVHIAIRKCYNKIAKLLIDHDKIDFDASENPILVAIKFKNTEIVKYLLPLLKFNISDKDLYVLFFI